MLARVIFNAFAKLINTYFFIQKRSSMIAMKKVRFAFIVVMDVIISHFTGGMELSKDNFKDLNTKCSTTGLFK